MMVFKKLTILFVFVSVVLVYGQEKELTFETLFKDRNLYGSNISGVKWFDNDNKYSFLKFDSISGAAAVFQHDVKTGQEKLLVSNKDFLINGEPLNVLIRNYEWSPGEKYILFTGLLPARSTKSGGTFYLYELKTKRFFIAAESDEEQVNAAFSPDGEKLGFVRNNNLFAADLRTGITKQLTFDGSDVILNGIFDWVYEEEFSIIKGWEWSPDSKHIAFWQLDQSPVPEIKIALYDSLYLNFFSMRYPKAGAPNSLVKIGVVNIEDSNPSGRPSVKWMDIGEETNVYIPRIKFTDDAEVLSIQRLNRLQNRLDLIFAEINTGSSKVILSETSSAWVDVFDDLNFPENGKTFVWTSEKDGYKHIYLYDYSGREIKQITRGEWETDKVIYADDHKIIFTANERGVRYTDLYTVKTDGSEFKRITREPGTHSINLSGSGKFYIDKYSTANTISSIKLFDIKGNKLRDLVLPDFSLPEKYGFSKVEFLSFTASDGTELNAAMIKPWNFDENKKYPVLFDIYGGPGSDPTKDRWESFSTVWKQLLAKNGYIIFMLDNRGTGGRGTAFKHIVYKRLGEMEVNDMIEGAKYLLSLIHI